MIKENKNDIVWNGKWIWDYGEESAENCWLCFRYSFTISGNFDRAYIWITADSRYTLYLNGKLIGSGPARSWPFNQVFDSYADIANFLRKGKNTIAVLVNHYGTSTSQYVQGRGGLLCQAGIYKGDVLVKEISTNEEWKTARHTGFVEKAIRINVAQPWVEIYDANNFHDNWYDSEYDDSNWSFARVIGNHDVQPWVSLEEWKYERNKIEKYFINRVVSINYVKPIGFNVTINFGGAISDSSRSNRDKKLLGYIFTNMLSDSAFKGSIILLSKKISRTSKRLIFNNKEYTFDENNEVEVDFNRGDNICLFDISGYYQTLEVSFLFKVDGNIKFGIPYLPDNNSFALIGPMEYDYIINVMAIDKTLNFDNVLYNNVWEIFIGGESEQFFKKRNSLLKPIPDKYLLYNNPHYQTIFRKTIEKTDVGKKYNQTITLFPKTDLDVEVVLDFGEELSGFLCMKIDCEARVVVDVEFSESMYDGKIEYPMDTNSAVRYITKAGVQYFRVSNRKGFRYVILTFRNFTNPIRLLEVTTEQTLYPVELNEKFECSDFKLNKIWEMCRRTLHLCMEDVYIDCPAYEQALWIGDARLEALFNYYLFGKYELTKRYNELTVQSLKRSKLPECQVPTGNPVILTAWIFLWMISLKEYFMFSGDKKELIDSYPHILNVINELKKNLKGNLLNIHAWNMFDWANMDTPTDGVITHLNALFVEGLKVSAFMASLVGDFSREKEFLSLSEDIADAINDNLWNESQKAYFDSIHSDGTNSTVFSIQTNILVYLYGIASDERKNYIEKYIRNPPDNFVKPGSPFSYFFYFEALAKMGYFADIVKLVKEKWGEMLNYGATTCWETFKGWETDRLTRSHCHGWSAAPVYFIGAYILGVRPVKPGFKEFLVKPETVGLEWASGYVPTPYGKIYVKWEKSGDSLNINVKAPEQLKYTIVYPTEE